jgi:hypothetical protein
MNTDHIAAVNELLHTRARLNSWELNFLSSMRFVKLPSLRQLAVLEILVTKTKAPSPRRRRGRRAGR